MESCLPEPFQLIVIDHDLRRLNHVPQEFAVCSLPVKVELRQFHVVNDRTFIEAAVEGYLAHATLSRPNPLVLGKYRGAKMNRQLLEVCGMITWLPYIWLCSSEDMSDPHFPEFRDWAHSKSQCVLECEMLNQAEWYLAWLVAKSLFVKWQSQKPSEYPQQLPPRIDPSLIDCLRVDPAYLSAKSDV